MSFETSLMQYVSPNIIRQYVRKHPIACTIGAIGALGSIAITAIGLSIYSASREPIEHEVRQTYELFYDFFSEERKNEIARKAMRQVMAINADRIAQNQPPSMDGIARQVAVAYNSLFDLECRKECRNNPNLLAQLRANCLNRYFNSLGPGIRFGSVV